MNKSRAIAFWTGGIVVVAAFAVAAIIVVSRPWAWNGTLKAVEYSQSQAVPDFDDSTHRVTSVADLKVLQQVLRDDGWHPGATVSSKPGCVGGIATKLKLTLSDGSTSKLDTYLCGADNDALTKDVTKTVSAWRTGEGATAGAYGFQTISTTTATSSRLAMPLVPAIAL
ncbi:hypothetical protein GCM10027568_00760 [Humibacter soli]